MIIIFELILHIESSLSCGRKEKCKGKKISSERVRGIFLVAGVGFEPHDLRVMSPTSYRTALPRDIIALGKLIPIRHCLLYHTFLPLSILFTDFLCDLLRQIILCAFLTYAFSFA